MRLTLLDDPAEIQENLTVSNILDCIHIIEDIDWDDYEDEDGI